MWAAATIHRTGTPRSTFTPRGIPGSRAFFGLVSPRHVARSLRGVRIAHWGVFMLGEDGVSSPGWKVLDYGYDASDGIVSRSMRVSNMIAVALVALSVVRIGMELALRRGTAVLLVHVPVVLAGLLALWFARSERRLASRLLALSTVAFVIAASSQLLGRGAGSHYYCPGLAALSWLILPRRLWSLATAFNVGAILLFANAELRLPEVGPNADPRLIGYAQAVALVTSFVVLGGASFVWMRAADNAQGELERLARTDGLTGVCNRRWFLTLGTTELARARRHARPLSLALLDIDHFKRVNDTHGHHAGDRVIQRIVELVAAELRTTDVLARVGGEEFALLLPETPVEGARICLERIRARIEALPIEIGPVALAMSVSVGVTCTHADDASVEAVMARADEGLYAAKHAGRNRVEVA